MPIITTAAMPWSTNWNTVTSHLPFLHGFMAGALVFRINNGDPNQIETLILQRASTDSFPLQWEYPSGSREASDFSPISTAVRELKEETGLVAHTIDTAVGLLPEAELRSDDAAFRDYQIDIEQGQLLVCHDSDDTPWGKVTFLVEVDADERSLLVDPKEHCDWRYVSESEVLECTLSKDSNKQLEFVSESVRRTILQGFRIVRTRLERESPQTYTR